MCHRKIEIVFELVFEITGAKLRGSAGDKTFR